MLERIREIVNDAHDSGRISTTEWYMSRGVLAASIISCVLGTIPAAAGIVELVNPGVGHDFFESLTPDLHPDGVGFLPVGMTMFAGGLMGIISVGIFLRSRS